jgi:phosphoglycolate phosphatase
MDLESLKRQLRLTGFCLSCVGMQNLAYDVILWDWNGTLLDDGRFGLDIINGMLRRRGMREPTREEHGRLFDFPVIRYYERLGFDFEAEPFETISQEFVDAYFAGVRTCGLREGTQSTLTLLREAGYRQSILSASRQDYLEELIRHYKLEWFFEELLGIDSVHAPGKTGRGVDWIRESGINPERVLLIGDTMHDAEVATGMGIDCWLIEGGHHPLARLAETGRPCVAGFGEIRERLLNNLSETLSR